MVGPQLAWMRSGESWRTSEMVFGSGSWSSVELRECSVIISTAMRVRATQPIFQVNGIQRTASLAVVSGVATTHVTAMARYAGPRTISSARPGLSCSCLVTARPASTRRRPPEPTWSSSTCTRTGSAATGTSRALDRWLIGVVRSPMCRKSAIHTGREVTSAEVNAADVAAGALTTFMAQRILANWRKYPKAMSVLLGPSSVEQHVSIQARDEVLREMQRCNAFAVEFHRWRDDWLARRATT
jgi:hypothetical protein